LTSIGNQAFSGCKKLTSIILPASLKTIGNQAFSDCNKLTSIILPNGLTSIGTKAFGYCYVLTSIDLPASLTSIGNQAFYYCTLLESVTVRATTPPTLGTDAFASTSASLVIKVPTGSVAAYQAATNWSTYTAKIEAIATP
jgi:hypothetical protein